jgi:phage nucleotide-binding protein
MVKLMNTSDVGVSGVKVLCFGESGAGKTTLIKTAPAPLVLSAEAGLLSLAGADIPYIEIRSMSDLGEAFQYVTESDEAEAFETICLDSISEIAEVVLSAEKKTAKDPRQAYGEMNTVMTDLIRAFRDLQGKNVYFSAKLSKEQDEMGRILYSPSMPGKRLAQDLAYFFDECFALRAEMAEDGTRQRAIQTDNDGIWLAKDRSGKLDFWEPADLGLIFKKIRG